MPLIDTVLLELELALLGIIATIIFTFAYIKRKELINWLIIYFFVALGLISNFLRNFILEFEFISFSFYGLTVIYLTIIVSREYYRMFIKKQERNKNETYIFQITTTAEIFLFSMINVGIILVFLTLIMQIRITLRKKSLTYVFMCLSELGALLTFIGNSFISLEVEGAHSINSGLDTLFITILITTGIVALIEDKITKSEKKYREAYDRSTFYKDLVAHDINNILQNVQSSAELLSIYLKDTEKTENFEEMTHLIQDQVKRGSNLVSNVRMLSEIEETEISLRSTEITKVLDETIQFIINSFQDRDINIKVENPYEKINCLSNELIREVFENILINAVKHNKKPNVEISIRISRVKRDGITFYKLEFVDNGIGIPDKLKGRIFERAFRKDKSISGMGLGLSLVKKIIDKYNGKIWVEDNVKGDHTKGSNFIVLLLESS
ncbi:MAG: sensor histidine kinase [Candidatus Hodarchaeota archaeon]